MSLCYHGPWKNKAKKVPIAGIDDKLQTTSVTLDGCFLPPQLIYHGTTSACFPSTTFPTD